MGAGSIPRRTLALNKTNATAAAGSADRIIGHDSVNMAYIGEFNHPKAITSPLSARHARAYVLNNWRRHRQDRGVAYNVDPYSSGVSFDGWKETGGTNFLKAIRADYEPLPVTRPQTWLLNVGWRRHGLISVREVPGERARRLVA